MRATMPPSYCDIDDHLGIRPASRVVQDSTSDARVLDAISAHLQLKLSL